MDRLFSSPWNLFFLLHLEPPLHPWVSNPTWSILQPFSWIPSFCSIFFLGHSLTRSFSWNLCPQELSRLRTFSRSDILLESSLGTFSWCLFLLLEPLLEPPLSDVSSFRSLLCLEPSLHALGVLFSSRACSSKTSNYCIVLNARHWRHSTFSNCHLKEHLNLWKDY